MFLNDQVQCYMGVISVRTDRPVVGRKVHVGAVEVGHSVVVGVGISCGRGQVQRPTRHLQRHGRVRDGHRGALSWGMKETTKQ